MHTLATGHGTIKKRLTEHLRAIFPTFGDVTVGTKLNQSQTSEILIWPTEDMRFAELGFPLTASGTGLGQVLAILGVVMTTNKSVIVIDEINSFLHPGAVKALLRLFHTEYSHHQYIISTHYPEVISFSNPTTVHLVSREGYRSRVTALDLEKIDDLREVSLQLGFSMADVFSADQIIWVEGPSEELCFPLLYQAFAQRSLPPTTKILSVVTTGDFLRKRDRALIWEIYESLSRKATPLVSNVKFSFDSEKMDDKAKDDLIQEAGSALNFLPRRHLECYLIDPPSIAEFIRERDECLSDDSESRLIEKVTIELTRLAAEKEFCMKKWNGNLNNNAWLSIVDAANLIKGVCNTVSQCRVSFHKNRDSLRLLQLVIKNNRTQVQELGEYVQQLVDGRA